MELRLISQDNELSELCAEVVADITQQTWSFSTCLRQNLSENGADFYILDVETDTNISPPERIQWNSSNLLAVVHRQRVDEMMRLLGFEPTIVLKPVTRATLSALLGFMISNHTSFRDDREQLLQGLLAANLKLQEYDQNRTNFLTRVVHDFRAPLTALSGYCSLLLDGPLGSLNENQEEIVQRMAYSAKRLVRMASAMVKLSVDRHVKRRPDLQKGDFLKTVNHALQEIRPIADSKKITIETVFAQCDGTLYFELQGMTQALVNLLENACKFTPRDGSIDLRGYPFFWERRTGRAVASLPRQRRFCDTKEPNSYRLDIRNSGPALAEKHTATIFEDFTSYSGGVDRSEGGLGLAICRMIIDQHRGCIWAENTNAGPMFSFVLPMWTIHSTSSVGVYQEAKTV